jgi:hypothetical protein
VWLTAEQELLDLWNKDKAIFAPVVGDNHGAKRAKTDDGNNSTNGHS